MVQSYLEKFSRQNNNPLQTKKAEGVISDEWDECFPKYDDVSLEEAIGLFYDDYYAEADRLLNIAPEDIRIFSMGCLNTDEGVKQILDFVGIEEQRILTSVRKNKS